METKIVPAGFFGLPDAEHVSAVIFNSSGTLAKFNRMGVRAGFGTDNVILIRTGTAVDLDPDASEPLEFRAIRDGRLSRDLDRGHGRLPQPKCAVPARSGPTGWRGAS